MKNNEGFGIQIITNGSVLREYTKDGKSYVAAPWNTNYQIRILVPTLFGNSHPYKRFLAVISVDGLNVMNGKRATPESSGYVVGPFTDNDIPGFRLNNHEVAAFQFGDRNDSYAALLDRASNVGVIGVIFFSEYDPPRHESGDFSFGTRGGGTRGGGTRGGGHDMGTRFGRRTEHIVTGTNFTKDREIARFTIEYASYRSLKTAGLITESLGEVNPFDDGVGWMIV